MEVMEEGNLMDRVPVLLQRDLQYYEVRKFWLQSVDLRSDLTCCAIEISNVKLYSRI